MINRLAACNSDQAGQGSDAAVRTRPVLRLEVPRIPVTSVCPGVRSLRSEFIVTPSECVRL